MLKWDGRIDADVRDDAAAESLADAEGGDQAVSSQFFSRTSFGIAVVKVLGFRYVSICS